MAAAGVLSTCTAGPGRVGADDARGPSQAARPGGLVLRKGQMPKADPIRPHPGPRGPAAFAKGLAAQARVRINPSVAPPQS